jgi:2-polyprenyl-3-methyl-5-hydroxy-6-metoxy-1,4-benzoquinol methylase
LFESLSSIIEASFPAQRVRVLDVGCGQGAFLKHLLASHPQYALTGVDLAHNQAPGIRFIQGSFPEVDISPGFEVITMLAVIEHFEAPVPVVKKAIELLAPGGLLCMMTLNSNSLLYRIGRALRYVGWRTPFERNYDTHHLQHFTNRSLRRLLETNGLVVERQWNHNFPLRAVDLPETGPMLKTVLKLASAAVFALSSPLNCGMLQTAICRIGPGASG